MKNQHALYLATKMSSMDEQRNTQHNGVLEDIIALYYCYIFHQVISKTRK